MIYISIDIKTSGLEPLNCNILSFAAIIEDTNKKLPFEEIPKFNSIILQKQITGTPTDITMNKEIISLMSEYLKGDDELRFNMNTHLDYCFHTEDEIVKEFYWFLDKNGLGYGVLNNSGGYMQIKDGRHRPMINLMTKPITINVAGKNFGTFDNLFLKELPWWQKLIRTRQRILDPSILFCNWNDDDKLPSLNECKKRADIQGEVTYDTIKNAWDVIQILRKQY